MVANEIIDGVPFHEWCKCDCVTWKITCRYCNCLWDWCLKPPLIEICSQRIFNLHWADPEKYRGLDTHLWAIYHKDFGGLITTLHHLDTGLDTGDIVLQGAIPLHHKMKLHELRAANTEVCVKLTISVIDMMNRFGEVTSRSQYNKGRYYTAMPSELKGICQKRFETYTMGLAHDSWWDLARQNDWADN